MKQKGSSKLLTKEELKIEVKNLEERLDIRFVTKGFLDDRLERLREELDDNAKKYRDEILTKLDGVMGEFEAIREDRELAVHQTSEMRQRVDNHEKRISALEKS